MQHCTGEESKHHLCCFTMSGDIDYAMLEIEATRNSLFFSYFVLGCKIRKLREEFSKILHRPKEV